MKVLVCGARSWDDKDVVFDVLDEARLKLGSFEVVTGGAPGPDRMAERWARRRGMELQVHRADWEAYGFAAGMIRNSKMLHEARPDAAIAFNDYGESSRGTTDMIAKCLRKGVPVAFVRHGHPIDRALEAISNIGGKR